MILLDSSGAHEKLPVSGAKEGRQFDALILEAEDVAALARLSPESLHNWLTHWQSGFASAEEACASS